MTARRFTATALFAITIVIAFGACQSAPPPRLDPPEASGIKALAEGFSPSGASGSLTMGFALSFGNKDAVQSWNLRIATGSVVVKEYSGVGGADLPETLSWNGRTDAGAIWPEGEYYAVFSVGYGETYNPSPVAWTKFVLVSAPPAVKAKADPPAFTPAGRGMAEPVSIDVAAHSRFAKVQGWQIDVLDPRGDLVRSFEGEGEAGRAIWDGKTTDGSWVEPSRFYTALVRATDAYGNVGESSLAIAVKEQPDAPERSAIRPQTPGFSPTGDVGTRNMNLALTFGNKEAVRSWAVEIATGSVVVKRFEGGATTLPASIAWDGRAQGGLPWPEGEYTPILSVDYGTAFNPARVVGAKFRLASSAPAIRLSAAPSSFTPSGEGMRENVSVDIAATSPLATVVGWSLDILDERGRTIRSFQGTGGGSGVSWDGRSKDGAWADPGVTYTAKLVARDEYGNKNEASILIPVKDRPEAPEASLVETDLRGFSPLVARNGGRIGFSLMIGSAASARSWKLEIAGATGAVKTFTGKATELPSELSWDGKDDNGALAPEGGYAATLSVDYGRTYKPAAIRTKDFLLAPSPPEGKLSLSPDHFVPAEAGVTAPVSILLDARPGLGKIEGWSLDILDSQGRVVKNFTRSWPANQVIWDGLTEAGAYVEPASSYEARAVMTDEFGNTGTASAEVSVLEIPAATELSVIEPRSSGFSPVAATSGKSRSIDFFLVGGNMASMKTWKVVISHAERGAQKSFQGDAASWKRGLTWDGRTEAGALAPDGSYYATLSIDYGKSFKPAVAKSTAFALQTAPPLASISLTPPGLKPKGGTFEKPVEIGLKASARFADIEGWTVSILDAAGKTVRFYNDAPGGKVLWDGITSGGSPAEPSATYTVVAEVRDNYGNSGTAKAYLAVADLPPVPGENAVVPALAGFSPNGDGVMDSIDLGLTVANRPSVSSWKIVLVQADQGPVKTFTGDAASLPSIVTWQGRTDAGVPAPEGSYTATMTIEYGTTFKASQVSSRRFVLGLTPPAATMVIAPKVLVPDEKGLVAPALISLDAKPALARPSSWKVSVLEPSGAVFSVFEGPWPPAQISWDGMGSGGRIAEPATTYDVVASVRDEFGVASELRDKVEVGALPAATEESSLRALAKGFSPAVKGSMKLALTFGNANLIKGWRIDLEREDKTVRMSFPGASGNLPDSFTWDGRLQDGAIAPDGRYSATLSVDYGRVYARTRVSSDAFVLASTPPSGALTVSPALFSPDGDGQAETCTIAMGGDSPYAAIKDWSVDIYDPGANLFQSFRGQWPFKTIAWNGRNAKNESVESAEDYPVVAKLRDEYGNTSELHATIKVDILIVKVGDGYRIRIASIVFKPYTADYMDVPADRAERNVTTLNLLAEKLKKFPGYQIRMAGHAVMVNWDDPVKGKAEQDKVLVPLSKARADAIRQALVARGIEASRMVSEGLGAQDPIVPDSDFDNRWKNRRVEFFLEKKN